MKIVTIIGARPQFIKAAVVSRAIKKNSDIEEIIVHTGQHYDANMSDVFFSEMGIPHSNYNLNINALSHGAMTGRMIIEKVKFMLNVTTDFSIPLYGNGNAGQDIVKVLNR